MDFSSSSQQQHVYASQVFDTPQVPSFSYPWYLHPQFQIPPPFQDYSSYYNTQYNTGYDHHHQPQQYPQHKSEEQIQLPQPNGGGQTMVTASVPDQQNGYYAVPGLNPAAVAFLSQITYLAGLQGQQWPRMDGPGLISGLGPEPPYYGARPIHNLAGCSGYRSGAGSFRGRGQGNIGNHPLSTGNCFLERECTHEMGGLGHSQQHGASYSFAEPFSAADKVESNLKVAETLAAADKAETKSDVSPQNGNAAVDKQPTRGARCELCKVDYTSQEIVEQHENGKRHKKTLQRSQILEIVDGPVAENCKEKITVGDSNPEVTLRSEKLMDGEKNQQSLPRNMPTEVLENRMEIQQPNDKKEKPNSSGSAKSDDLVGQSGNQRSSLKRKKKGSCGGKQTKAVGLQKPPKPKIIAPFICNLCNIKCDTKDDFDKHLSGKKHKSKLKRFGAHQANYGPVGLQALYPPPHCCTKSVPSTRFSGPQAFDNPQGSYPPQENVPPQSHSAGPAETGKVSGLVQHRSPHMSNGTS